MVMLGSEESLIIFKRVQMLERFFGRKLPQNDFYKPTE